MEFGKNDIGLYYIALLQQLSYATTPCYGIMITASHNPRQDAGYKIYGGDGCQIRAPVDRDVAASIQANLEPWIDYRAKLRSLESQSPNDPCRGLSEPRCTRETTDAYFGALKSGGVVAGQAAQWKDDDRDAPNDSNTKKRRRRPTFCYTALHGVCHPFAQRAFQVFGLPPFISVPAQQQPDAAFPTSPFPTPKNRAPWPCPRGTRLPKIAISSWPMTRTRTGWPWRNELVETEATMMRGPPLRATR